MTKPRKRVTCKEPGTAQIQRYNYKYMCTGRSCQIVSITTWRDQLLTCFWHKQLLTRFWHYQLITCFATITIIVFLQESSTLPQGGDIICLVCFLDFNTSNYFETGKNKLKKQNCNIGYIKNNIRWQQQYMRMTTGEINISNVISFTWILYVLYTIILYLSDF